MSEYKVGDILLTNNGQDDWGNEYKFALIIVNNISQIKVNYSYLYIPNAINYEKDLTIFNKIIHNKVGEAI